MLKLAGNCEPDDPWAHRLGEGHYCNDCGDDDGFLQTDCVQGWSWRVVAILTSRATSVISPRPKMPAF